MDYTINLGELLITIVLSLVGLQARQVVGELRSLRLDVTHLERWAAKRGYEPRAQV